MRTLFFEFERSLGAEFEDYSGWELPSLFSPFEEEYNSVRQRVGVIDLSFRGKVKVAGKERSRFLQSMLSNEIEKLPAGSGVSATLLTNKGRMIGYLRVYNVGEWYLLDVDHQAREAVFETLTNYRLSLRVTLEDVSNDLAVLSVQGPYAPNLLVNLAGDNVRLERELDHVEAQLDLSRLEGAESPQEAIPVRIIRVSHTGEAGFDLIANRTDAEGLWTLVNQCGEDYGLEPVGMRALNVLRLEAGIPWFGIDFDTTTIPLEAGLDQALSFNKGCYVGQETIAMIKYRGHINRKLVGLRLEDQMPPNAGCALIHDQTEVGRITSAAFSPMLSCTIALGYVKREFIEPGTRLIVKTGEQEAEAEVVQLPFLKT